MHRRGFTPAPPIRIAQAPLGLEVRKRLRRTAEPRAGAEDNPAAAVFLRPRGPPPPFPAPILPLQGARANGDRVRHHPEDGPSPTSNDAAVSSSGGGNWGRGRGGRGKRGREEN